MTTTRLATSMLTTFVVGLVIFGAFSSCNDYYRNKAHSEVSDESIVRGKKLARKYCQSCHMLPDPSMLDAQSWEKGVMPQMGPRLGIFEYWFQQYPSEAHNRNLDKSYYPSTPQIRLDEWQDLINYYIATSPDTLAPQERDKVLRRTLPFFDIRIPSGSYNSPATGLVKVDPLGSSNSFFISDLVKKTLYRYNSNFNLLDSTGTPGPLVDLEVAGKSMLACNIGELNPHVGKSGAAEALNVGVAGKIGVGLFPLFKDLERPVQILPAHFNSDNKLDYLVCEFGYLTGSLSWYENIGNNSFRKQVLRAIPGALKAYVNDYNKDGLQDIWVLFAQGDEGIWLFTNKGNGNFDSKELLRFPPVYGSSYFELTDFDKDGDQDIIYTAGDNADFTPVLKPYHGLYIFINDGDNEFQQEYFFPINGCYKALARDYDQDGDLDIATIAFFPDSGDQPEESFIYLENRGSYEFIPYSFPESHVGRWLSMDAGDLDDDGKVDLILGNFSIAPDPMKNKISWQKGPPFIVLKNISK